jgi:hypothetical protein
MDDAVLVAAFLALASAGAACVAGACYQHRRRAGAHFAAGPGAVDAGAPKVRSALRSPGRHEPQ